MYHFINDDIKIDFPLPQLMANTVREAEELDAAGDIDFYNVSSAIDVLAKGYVACGLWTEEQWNLICSRYPTY